MPEIAKKEIVIPEGIDVKQEGKKVAVKGSKGEIERIFNHPLVKLSVKGNNIKISTEEKNKKIKAILGTWAAHLNNMLAGVEKGFEAKMKMVYTHFPVKLSTESNEFIINNFMGEKKPRKVSLPEGVDVKIQKDEVVISGINRDTVGQAAAKIEQLTIVRGYDRRVFQDGCWLTQKAKEIEHDQ
ncbi:MAG: 50S ribosomal protein L6 [Candidatus Aenigmarchaeota archaeon]|nr:50S ribosomal protein L6 [Candidatus Aenigmarchaeota archaeon]